MKIHIAAVEGQKNHKCDLCGKAFRKKDSIKIHIATVHEGQKNYKCEFCGKSFGQIGDRNMHIRNIHKGL